MEANKILNADILDIIFEGKNKSYGAYQLRKTYNSRMSKAMITMGVFLILLFLFLFLQSRLASSADKEVLETIDTELAEVKKDEPVVVPPPPPPKPPPPPVINQVQFTPPKIVKDEQVKPDEKIEEIKEDQAISTETIKTDVVTQVVQAPVEDKGTQVVEVPTKAVEEDKIFTKVEIEAEYPGGQGAWGNYLRKNLNGSVAVDNGAEPGSYTVIVKFIVSKDGTISDVTAETNMGKGMEQEAIRVIKKGPKWKPAQQNGNIVNAYRRQPITFVVAEE